jgi:hypothetical protein
MWIACLEEFFQLERLLAGSATYQPYYTQEPRSKFSNDHFGLTYGNSLDYSYIPCLAHSSNVGVVTATTTFYTICTLLVI